MTDPLPSPDRRDFLCGAASLGLVGLASACGVPQKADTHLAEMPTRPLGRSGVPVPILMFGAIDLQPSSRLLLHQALLGGAWAWETSESYGMGNSELAIGAYLESFPEARKRLFLLTKSTARDQAGLDRALDASLQRLKTQVIDLYLLHGVSDPAELSPAMASWAEKAKASGKIRLFGYSVHSNMETVLAATPALGWIDAVLSTCSFRHLALEGMRRALDACASAGVGLIAMKTQGESSLGHGADLETNLRKRFMDGRGYTLAQARLKAVWEHQGISSIVSKMPNTRILEENVAAALNRAGLAAADHEALRGFAQATRSTWCAGCGRCQAETGLPLPDLMRCLMYERAYGDPESARALFAHLARSAPSLHAPELLARAEASCPNAVPLRDAAALAWQKLA